MTSWRYKRCMYTLTTDDLYMQLDVIIIISTIQFSVYKQQCRYTNRSMVS